MDPNLIMAIDIVDVLRMMAAQFTGEHHRVLLHAATHIEVLRKAADKPVKEIPISRSYDPDSYKVIEE